MDRFTTVAERTQTEYIEKKSRFIATVMPVASEEEAIAFVNSVRSTYPDARHNVYAYDVMCGGVRYTRYSDDGEPQGTAGTPVLDCILKRGLTNTAVVVTRYFGGILLGAAGLLRAYSKSASDAIEAAGTREIYECKMISYTVSYADSSRLRNILSNLPSSVHAVVGTPEYSEKVTFNVEIYVRNVDDVNRIVTDGLAGRVEIGG